MNKCEICSIKKKCDNYKKVNENYLCSYIKREVLDDIMIAENIRIENIASINHKLLFSMLKVSKFNQIFDQIEKMNIKSFNVMIGFVEKKKKRVDKPTKK